jgi:hypothetical protein
MQVITYAEMEEIKTEYEKLAVIRMGELPDTAEFDLWLSGWCKCKGCPIVAGWKQFNVHVVPTEEHRERILNGK